MKHWTSEERSILRDNYYLVSAEKLAEMLPGRTRRQCVSQVHYLRKRGWAFKGRMKK